MEQSILTVALFDLPAALELRWASENGDQKSRSGHRLGSYLSISGVHCNVRYATSIYIFGHTCLSNKKTSLFERFRLEFFKLSVLCPDWIHEFSFDWEHFGMWPLCYCAGGRGLFSVTRLLSVEYGHVSGTPNNTLCRKMQNVSVKETQGLYSISIYWIEIINDYGKNVLKIKKMKTEEVVLITVHHGVVKRQI